MLPVRAQVHFVPSVQRHVAVESYMGAETVDNFFDFRFEVEGADAVYADWSLSVRLLSPVVAVSGGPGRSGRPFPVDRIAFRWTVEDGRPGMNVRPVGEGREAVSLRETDEVLLVNRAEVPIASHPDRAYADIRQFGSIKIAPGAYLDDCLAAAPNTPITYSLPLAFTLYDGQMRVIGTQQSVCELALQPQLADAVQAGVPPDYALTVEPAAQNTLLAFQTSRDYAEGVSVTVHNAVRVNAKTDYEVSVRALDGSLRSESGDELPLSVLSVRLIGGANARPIAGSPSTVPSPTGNAVLRGASSDKKTPQYFHLRYDAKIPPAQQGALRPGTYVVPMVYQLLPR